MTKAVICAYARTPIGKFRGALSNYSATELGSKVVEELLKRVRIDPESGIVDQVYICLLYTSPSPRDRQKSRMPSSA